MDVLVNGVVARVPSFFACELQMVRKEAAKDQDKFVVRLPAGMRERIKAKADRAGMSMNEAIVWCLEQTFPAPITVEEKLDELAELVAVLKGDDTYKGVDILIREVQEAIEEIAERGSIGSRPDFLSAVQTHYEKWQELELERQEQLREQYENPFDDANYPVIGGVPFEEIDWDAPIDPNDPLAARPRKSKA